MPTPHPLVAELRRARTRRGLGQAVAAQLGGRHPKTLLKWENGERSPRLGDFTDYAAAHGFDLVLVRRTDQEGTTT
jgi:transcriptional regulator with XRE-family HTH domain